MRRDRSSGLDATIFPMLVSLLRPVARRQAARATFPEAVGAPLPAQHIEWRLTQAGGWVEAELQLWLRCAESEPLVVAWVLPMPRAAMVRSLELHPAVGATERAGLCARREARTWFDLARRNGLPGVILAEDAPGVFSLEMASSGRGAGARISLRYCFEVEEGLGDASLTLRCEASPAHPGDPSAPARILRLGSGGRFDRIIGLASATVAGGAACDPAVAAQPGPSGRRASNPAAAAPPPRPDVYASYDHADGSSAMFRGRLAGRLVRLWADVRTTAPVSLSGAESAPRAELDRLMDEYRSSERSEAERRQVAARIEQLGLDAGLATLWTSFVAIANGEGPGGEIAFAAA